MENKEVERTLNSLDGLTKAQPGAFFYDKVMMKLDNKEAKVVYLAPKLAWQVAAGLLLLVTLNVFVWASSKPTENPQAQNSNPIAQEYFTYMNTVQF